MKFSFTFAESINITARARNRLRESGTVARVALPVAAGCSWIAGTLLGKMPRLFAPSSCWPHQDRTSHAEARDHTLEADLAPESSAALRKSRSNSAKAKQLARPSPSDSSRSSRRPAQEGGVRDDFTKNHQTYRDHCGRRDSARDGVALLVLPGPAFVVIPVGLRSWPVEFAWARRLLLREGSRIFAEKQQLGPSNS